MASLNNLGYTLRSLARVLGRTAGLFTKSSPLIRGPYVLETVPSARPLHTVMPNVLSCACRRNKEITESSAKRHGLLQNSQESMIMNVRNCSSKQFQAPSPYKKPGPRRYGYRPKFYTEGLLPRLKTNAPLPIPEYKPSDPWTYKASRQGQNDYIDLLGDGSIHPVDLYKAPPWLVGFRGNEMRRLLRQMQYEGATLKQLSPARYSQINKRIRFLYKKYNIKRSRRN